MKKKIAFDRKKEKQPNLYGDEDKVFNVLETDVTSIKSDISNKYDKIGKLNEEIKTLQVWLKEVMEARDIVAKKRKTAGQKKK